MKEKEKKTKNKNESKPIENAFSFQRQTTLATLVPAIPKFKGICPNY